MYPLIPTQRPAALLLSIYYSLLARLLNPLFFVFTASLRGHFFYFYSGPRIQPPWENIHSLLPGFIVSVDEVEARTDFELRSILCLTTAAIATRCIFFPFYPNLDNICGSPDPWINFERAGRAVVDTGPAFHTRVKIDNNRLAVLHCHDMLRADMGAQTTPDTFSRIQYESTHIFKVSESFHLIIFLILFPRCTPLQLF